MRSWFLKGQQIVVWPSPSSSCLYFYTYFDLSHPAARAVCTDVSPPPAVGLRKGLRNPCWESQMDIYTYSTPESVRSRSHGWHLRCSARTHRHSVLPQILSGSECWKVLDIVRAKLGGHLHKLNDQGSIFIPVSTYWSVTAGDRLVTTAEAINREHRTDGKQISSLTCLRWFRGYSSPP